VTEPSSYIILLVTSTPANPSLLLTIIDPVGGALPPGADAPPDGAFTGAPGIASTGYTCSLDILYLCCSPFITRLHVFGASAVYASSFTLPTKCPGNGFSNTNSPGVNGILILPFSIFDSSKYFL